MASVEKQLLGTETTRALRSKGVTSIICGLSANDVKRAFLESGADAFLLKPIPSRKEALTTILMEILNGRSSNNDAGQHSVINGVHEENHLGSNS
jgi:DNA-binding response OmpR family regulator